MDIDITIATGVFIAFIAIMTAFTINYFSQAPVWGEIARYKEKAISFIESISSKGFPYNWEEQNITPAQLGLSIDLYKVQVQVKENSGYSRVNEPVFVNIIFDSNCEKKAWNNTVRVYDEGFNEIPSFISNEVFCSSYYLKKAYITFQTNISANQTKNFQIFYSNDTTIDPPSYDKLNLTAYWTFDEGSGTLAKDYSGNENNGTLYNGTTICSGGDCPNWVDGKYGKAIKFDGIDDYVEIPSFNTITTSFTLVLWAKFERYGQNTFAFLYGGSQLRFNTWNSTSTGPLEFQVYGTNDTGDVSGFSIYDIIPYNEWINIVVQFNTEDNKWYVYVNGVQYVMNNPWASSYFTLNKGRIGGPTIWSALPTNGTIDEVRIYNRALTEEEISVLYASSPLSVKKFPTQKISAISQRKLQALRNLTYEELREALGEEYKFRIEIKPE